MAARKKTSVSKSPGSAEAPPTVSLASDSDRGAPPLPAGTTGRMLLVFEEGESRAALSSLQDRVGLSDVAQVADYHSDAFDLAEVAQAEVLYLNDLDVAIVQPDSEQRGMLASLGTTRSSTSSTLRGVKKVIAERYVLLTDGGIAPRSARAWSRDYLDGYIDALSDIRDHLFPADSAATLIPRDAIQAAGQSQCYQDSDAATWGLQAMGVPASKWTGRGIKVAILDTGFDIGHPDFAGRNLVAQSFSQLNSDGQDFHGHGTHTAGTACGGIGLHGRRYGIASEADIFIGQVFAPSPSGATSRDGDIWAGIRWAMTKGCQVVSMSLERTTPVQPGEAFHTNPGKDNDYEDVASRALKAGTLLVAAGGNGSTRQNGKILPVNEPANAPSVLAVGSIGPCLAISNFSPRSLNLEGGRVDFIAPGEGVISAAPMPTRYRIDQGTSMATPHVAGIAVLISQAHGGIGGIALWKKLAESTRGLGLPAVDAGFGLPMAPP